MTDKLAVFKAARQSLAASIAQQTAALEELDRQIELLKKVPEEQPDARLTAKEVTKLFKFSLRTLYNKIDRGEFPAPASRNGRRYWTKRQIDALLSA